MAHFMESVCISLRPHSVKTQNLFCRSQTKLFLLFSISEIA